MNETIGNNESELMSEAAILGALQVIQTRISKAEAQRAELAHVVALAKEEKQLLERLLALRRGEIEIPKSVRPPETRSAPTDDAASGLNHPVVEAVLSELEQAGRPVHISDLMRRLQERRVHIPGLGTQANLISYLRRDKRLVRPSRGMYALAASGLADVANVVRRKRRRRKMRSASRDRGKQI